MTPAGDVSLRDVLAEDISTFYEQQLEPEGTEMAAFPPRAREEHAAHWQKVLSDPTTVNRTIVTGGRVAGNVVSWIQDGHRELGYWLGKEYWGRGIATAALTLFLDVVTERPLQAWVAAHNRGSLRVLEKVGFTVAPEQPEPDTGATRYVVMELSDG
jgi:RimJ/RimL family protein N-acetyltransferase